MARYAISPEGAAAMRSLASNLLKYANNILEASIRAEQEIAGVGDEIGIYESEILGLVSHNRSLLKADHDAILSLAQLIAQKADQIEELVSLTSPATGTASEGNLSALTRPQSNVSSEEHASIVKALDGADVSYRPISAFGRDRATEEIIGRLGGGDMTQGSCSSLAFAYVGNKAGYDVLDFRDGSSRSFFSSNSSIEMITKLPGVTSEIVYGKNDSECANRLLSSMTPGKEYYLATGQHAAIVRNNNGNYEYLELQSAWNNGWQGLNDSILANRFGCAQSGFVEYPNFLIDVDSLAGNQEFLDILGYINTAEAEQRKGGAGHVR